MKKANLYVGILLVIIFLITGYYMKHYFKPAHLSLIDDPERFDISGIDPMKSLENLVVRMETRANHLYILYAGLLNIVAYKLEITFTKPAAKYFNIGFRTLLLIAGAATLWSFAYEHNGVIVDRPATFVTAISSLSAVVFYMFNELVYSKKK